MMSDDDDDEPDYEVGYRKPPVEHRFKKGRSGNPAGRPRNAKTRFGGHPMDSCSQEAWLDEAKKVVTVTINGRRVRRTMGQLAIQRAFADAAAGKPTAMRVVAQKMSEAVRLRRERWIEDIDVTGLLHRRATAELQERLAAGEVDPVVLPHPDDFVFNRETGTVDIVGPTDLEQHKAAMVLVRSCLPLVAMLNSVRFARADDPDRARIIDELQDLNSSLPPRLQQWPTPQFPEDYSLFPEECVKRWVLDRTDVGDRS
jgi:hypothetical protein